MASCYFFQVQYAYILYRNQIVLTFIMQSFSRMVCLIRQIGTIMTIENVAQIKELVRKLEASKAGSNELSNIGWVREVLNGIDDVIQACQSKIQELEALEPPKQFNDIPFPTEEPPFDNQTY